MIERKRGGRGEKERGGRGEGRDSPLTNIIGAGRVWLARLNKLQSLLSSDSLNHETNDKIKSNNSTNKSAGEERCIDEYSYILTLILLLLSIQSIQEPKKENHLVTM